MNKSRKSNASRTATISLRIPKDILAKLHSESAHREINLNTLVTQIFTRFVEWDGAAPKSKIIPVPKQVLLNLLNRASVEEVASIAESFVRNENRTTILIMRNEYNINTVLSVLESWIRAAGFSYRKDYLIRHYKYVINHEMGVKWSIFFKVYLDTVFQDLGMSVQIQYTDNVVSLTLPASTGIEE